MLRLNSIIYAVVLLVFSCSNSWANGKQYDIRVDGLVCPFCAYGLEKQFIKMQGIESFNIDLDNGTVTVKTSDTVEFSNPQLKRIINDAGFTFKSFIKTDN